MNRIRIPAIAANLAVAAVVLLAGPAAAQALPTFHVAYLHDGPVATWADGLRDSLSAEVERVLAPDFQVLTPAESIIVAEATQESCREALLALLARPEVDLVIASGPLGSLEAAHLASRPKPIIGTIILDADLQGVALVDGTSGTSNFTFVTPPGLLQADLAALDAVVDYENLVVLASARYLGALPGNGQALAELTGGEVVGVPVDGPTSAILEAIPAATDAVYVLPLVTSEEARIHELLAGLKDRGLPVLAMRGERDVRAGALVGVAPNDWLRQVFRRVALAAGRIAAGEDAAGLPVLLPREGKTVINARTARAIGVSPSFSFLIDAVQIGRYEVEEAERLDIFMVMNEAQLNNQDIASTQRLVLAGQEEVSGAASVLLPQMDAALSGTIVDDDRAAYLPTLSERTFGGHLSLTQILWSDQAWASYSVAKDLQTARRQELVRVRLNVGLEAAAAYLEALRADTHLQVQRQNLAFSRTNLERAQVRVDVGDANRSELYRWESKIAGEKAAVVTAVTRRKDTEFELNRVLSRPLENPAELADATLDDQLALLSDPRVDAFTGDPAGMLVLRDFLTGKGLATSPELLQFDASIKAQKRTHTAATRSFWSPTIGLTGNLDHAFDRSGVGSDMSAADLPDDTEWSMSVFMSLPIFRGGGRFAETRRTTQEVYRLERVRHATAERIERDVRSAVFQAAASRLTIDLSRQATEAARLNLGLVSDNYTLGRALLVDLIDAQTNALNAELSSADAVYLHLLDLMRVERAVGRFTFFTEVEDKAAWMDELEAFAADR